MMKKSRQSQARESRRLDTRRKFLRIERLEERVVFSVAPPVAMNDQFQTLANQTLEVDTPAILANDTDAEGDALTAQLFSGPSHGELTLNADGSFQYTPESGFTGIDSFLYQAYDGTGSSNLAAVTLQVGGNGPIAENDAFSIGEDGLLAVTGLGVLENDSDLDGDSLTASLVTGPQHGTLEFAADGTFTYTPNADFSGIDGFSYRVNDGTADSGVAAVTINVTAVNDAPIANNEEYTTEEDTALVIDPAGVLTNDTDLDGDPLTPALVQGPTNGTVTLNPDGSFSYTPNADFNGVDGFSYSVNDGTADSDVAAVTINVTPVGDAPVAGDDEFATDEDTPLVVAAPGLFANDTDADADLLTAALVSGPTNGALTLNPDGSFSYTPNADFNGVDSFTYSVNDGTGDSNVATVTINVNAVNDAPVAGDDEFVAEEDTPLVVPAPGVFANDSDSDGDTLTAAVVSGPANGTLTMNPDGSFTYTPNADFNGVDSFSYVANDGVADSEAAVVTINVNAVNDRPVVADDEFVTDEDTALVVDPAGVLENDSDIDGGDLTVSLVSGPTNGELTLNPDGSFSYTPNADFNGVDSFSYSVNDGTADSGVATVTITVNAVNDAPVAADDAFVTDEDTALVVDPAGVLANDSDIDSSDLTVNLVSGPTNGELTLNADGSFSYTPSADFNGEDSFSYSVNDGTLESGVAVVLITVNAVNDGPVANDDEYATDEDKPLVVDAAGVLTNDVDLDGGPLTATVVSGPTNGELTLNADGSFSYTPNADFNGVDSFSYSVNDGTADSGVATVTIAVNAVNDAPMAVDDEYVTDEDVPLVVDPAGVLANDSDIDGGELTAEVVSPAANGTVVLNADGSFTYTPNADFNGTDSFTYAVSDGTASAEATVNITVNSLPDIPQTQSDAYNTGEDISLNVLPEMGVLANESDSEGRPLTAELVRGPEHGTLTLNADGSFSYVPNENYFGEDSFTYVANNGVESSAETVATILVQSLNDSPVAVDDVFGLTANTSLDLPAAEGVIANDTDVEADPLTATLITAPEHGVLVLNPDGSFNYTPELGFTGSDSFQYQLSDGMANSNVATVALEVIPAGNQQGENERPVAVNDHYNAIADQPLVVEGSGVLGNDPNPEEEVLTASLFTNPDHGTVTLNADGSFVYTPNAGYSGRDSFMYRISDGTHDSPLATVTIDIAPAPQVNDPDLGCSGELQGNVLRNGLRNLLEKGEDFFASLSSRSRNLAHSDIVDALLTSRGWSR